MQTGIKTCVDKYQTLCRRVLKIVRMSIKTKTNVSHHDHYPAAPPPRSPIVTLVSAPTLTIVACGRAAAVLPFGNDLPDPTILCKHVHTAHWNVRFTTACARCNVNLLCILYYRVQPLVMYKVQFALTLKCVSYRNFTQFAHFLNFNVHLVIPAHTHRT